jgi:hypothetical protein
MINAALLQEGDVVFEAEERVLVLAVGGDGGDELAIRRELADVRNAREGELLAAATGNLTAGMTTLLSGRLNLPSLVASLPFLLSTGRPPNTIFMS